MKKVQVAIIMGSDSDLPVMKDAAKTLEEFDVLYKIRVVSAHRTPDMMYEFAKEAKEQGIKIIIAGAGGSAHLPGMTASLTTLPVIGVPVKTKSMKGLDSLLSIVQMPPGVPVATVAVNGSKNAALLALKILALEDKNINKKLVNFQNKTRKEVLSKSKNLEFKGFEKYLKEKK